MKKHIKISMIFLLIFISFTYSVFAADANITIKKDSSFHLSASPATLQLPDRFAPGDEIVYSMDINNETNDDIDFFFKDAVDEENTDIVSQLLFEFYVDGELVFSKDYNSAEGKFITTIPSKEQKQISRKSYF